MEFSWEIVLQKISEKISKPSFETWFKPTVAELNSNTLTIYAPNSFARDWLETHYEEMIGNVTEEIFSKPFEIIITNRDNANAERKSKTESVSTSNTTYDLLINQNKLLQEKMEELEKRIQLLEQRLEH
ncbi:DnaA-like protein [Ureibacillus xyleni]|uniref:DnaA-like protein n=1 Tax=Ureibacillus xyleni TaxID=614648 RepID=A0A285S5Y1_9BACL|nr:DnaA N-terminal domain-containing protein [Ureibacillus xyleni]SOC02763.1 DnaA-like protein [Ureibacillus xyleni]